MTGRNNGRKAKNLQYIRNSNRAGVFRLLALRKMATRTELTRYLGLSKMAISNIVNELIDEKLVSELTDNESEIISADNYTDRAGAGRRSQNLKLHNDRFSAIGIYVSRDSLQAVAADISGRIHQTWSKPLNFSKTTESKTNITTFEQALTELATEIKTGLTSKLKHLKIIGIGLSSIGPLDVNSGLLLNPPNFHGVEMLDLGKLISYHFSQPLFIDNDMNAAAWAEHLYGAARGLQHSVYLGLTNGIGAGIIAYGRVIQGSAGYGGEVGHMCVQMDGPVCHCGRRGCLEAYISLPVLMEKTGLSSLDELLSRACEADYKLLWQPEYIEALKTGLINIVNIFDPDIVLLGHDGAALTRDFLPELEQSVNDGIFQKRARAVKLALADFKDQAPLIGSAALVFQAVFRGDLQP